MIELVKEYLQIANKIQNEIRLELKPPSEGFKAESEQVISFSIVINTRGYIEKVVNQINGCYEKGWYDGCAVMIRRLIETLIIESYEHYNISDKIKNINGDFIYLKDLIDKVLIEPSWNLGRNTKKSLPKLKDIGDKSAHSRRFIAHRNDIDKIIDDLRIVVQEFIYLANLK